VFTNTQPKVFIITELGETIIQYSVFARYLKVYEDIDEQFNDLAVLVGDLDGD